MSPETRARRIGAGPPKKRSQAPAASGGDSGPAEGADLIFAGPAPAIAGAVYGGVPIETLEAEGALQVEGDRGFAARFLTLFPLPPKAG